ISKAMSSPSIAQGPAIRKKFWLSRFFKRGICLNSILGCFSIDLFGGGRMVGKLSYFRPHEGFLREYSHSYTTEKRHSVGRKEPICSHHTTRRTSLVTTYGKSRPFWRRVQV